MITSGMIRRVCDNTKPAANVQPVHCVFVIELRRAVFAGKQQGGKLLGRNRDSYRNKL